MALDDVSGLRSDIKEMWTEVRGIGKTQARMEGTMEAKFSSVEKTLADHVRPCQELGELAKKVDVLSNQAAQNSAWHSREDQHDEPVTTKESGVDVAETRGLLKLTLAKVVVPLVAGIGALIGWLISILQHAPSGK